uniref:Ribonuclease H n=1 Tax=Aplanochytrium stocchinoi TaxID=215587 RepID=A0A6S8B204_9STRA
MSGLVVILSTVKKFSQRSLCGINNNVVKAFAGESGNSVTVSREFSILNSCGGKSAKLGINSLSNTYKLRLSVRAMGKNRSKYYAVRKGRKPGIYLTWTECETQVKGFRGAQFKSFKTESDAHQYIRELNSSIVSNSEGIRSAPRTNNIPISTKRKGERFDIDVSYSTLAFTRYSARTESESDQFSGALSSEFDTHGQTRLKKRRVVKPLRPKETKKAVKDSDHEPGTIIIYTDGACSGNSNVAYNIHPAGWGFVVLEKKSGVDLVQLHESFGAVTVDGNSKNYIGAEVTSNNTAELSAIAFGLQWILEQKFEKPSKVVFRYDSEYAAKSVQGHYKNSKKNLKLIAYTQGLLTKARRRGNNFAFQHVKGHAGNHWNERADLLARRGCMKGIY